MNVNMNSLKSVALSIKKIVKDNKDVDVELYAKELSKNSSLDFYDVLSLYNDMSNIRATRDSSNLKKRIWTQSEDNLILSYLNISKKEEKRRPITEIIDDISELLPDRSASSISFRYYNVLTKKDNKTYADGASDDASKKIEVDEPDDAQKADTADTDVKSKEDLLDIIVELVDNVEMAELDVTSLFKSLLHLSAKAVDKKNLEEIKRLQEMLDKEKELNTSLRNEIKEMTKDLSILKREFENFSRMNGKEKIKSVNSFTNSVKYVVDKFGNINLK